MSRLVWAAVLVMAGAAPVIAQPSSAPEAAGSAQPARGPSERSIGAPHVPAGTSTATGRANPEPGVQEMNDAARRKLETEGK